MVCSACEDLSWCVVPVKTCHVCSPCEDLSWCVVPVKTCHVCSPQWRHAMTYRPVCSQHCPLSAGDILLSMVALGFSHVHCPVAMVQQVHLLIKQLHSLGFDGLAHRAGPCT